MSTTVVSSFLMSDEHRVLSPQPSNGERSRVCRSLFGPVDHESNRRILHTELARIDMENAKRWNFNFSSETPLPGRFEWTVVDERSNVHPTYALRGFPYCSQHAEQMQIHETSSNMNINMNINSNSNSNSNSNQQRIINTEPDQPSSSTLDEEDEETTAQNEDKTTSSRQREITDFLRVRKRLPTSTATGPSAESKKKTKAS